VGAGLLWPKGFEGLHDAISWRLLQLMQESSMQGGVFKYKGKNLRVLYQGGCRLLRLRSDNAPESAASPDTTSTHYVGWKRPGCTKECGKTLRANCSGLLAQVYQGMHNWCLSFVNILYSEIILLFAKCRTVKVCSGRWCDFLDHFIWHMLPVMIIHL